MEEKKKGVTTPKTPEPPQRKYPVSEPGKGKSDRKQEKETEKKEKK